MNRFNGLCKVCSERRYRQVGAWPLGGCKGCRWWVWLGGSPWQDFSPHKAFLAPSCSLQVHCDPGGG